VDDRQFGYTTKLKKKRTWNFNFTLALQNLEEARKPKRIMLVMTMTTHKCQSK
jgi:hypothetical protein